ncbi:MAG: glycosyltransferase family 4 protein [Lachnospiraceae bacterium]|jgi:glycosyltransferase involved in cell wall biosynthesis|nr:glycosyltransferase family 4 protein [Lachnospiraceae bacterium]
MKRAVIITNIPAPYRVDFFYYLQTQVPEMKFYIIYSSTTEDNRRWEVNQEKIKNSFFLESFTIKVKKRYDTKYIHIPRGVRQALDRIRPDVVIGSEYNPTIIQAVCYCKRRGIPYVSWTDGTLFSERNINRFQKVLRKYVICSAAAYIASSTKSKEAQQFYGADSDKIRISYLTVDVDRYRQERCRTQERRLLCVGSLIERKGMDLLLRACARIQEQTSWHLVLAGQGPEEAGLRRLAKSLGIEEKVEFLGYLNQKELLQEYERSFCLVLPTREDCFALVILEAMCSGLPVICSRYADGAYDLIEEGINGYIVDPLDGASFTQKIEALLKDPDEAWLMGERAREMAEKFRFSSVSQGFLEAVGLALLKKEG